MKQVKSQAAPIPTMNCSTKIYAFLLSLPMKSHPHPVPNQKTQGKSNLGKSILGILLVAIVKIKFVFMQV